MGEDDLAVIGGGLIGLATARAFLLRNPGRKVVVLEKERELASHQSGRNSGVVHAGLYYPVGSLKATLCRRGRTDLLRFADEHSIPYSVSGKVVVALTEAELPRLAELARRGEGNGLRRLRELSGDELREIEPHVAGIRALHVPETAVIDFRLVARALAADVEAAGGEILLGREVTHVGARRSARVVRTRDGGVVAARRVVSCAGVQADRVAARGGAPASDYRIAPFRGDFSVLSPVARPLVRGLIYPVPDPTFPFLGVHFTRRIDGEVWAGPNAIPSLAREGYSRTSVDLRDARDLLGYRGVWRLARRYARTGAAELWRAASSAAALRQMRAYIPELEARHLTRGPSGIRAQVVRRDGSLVDDFLIERSCADVHVVNAPSPAATAALAIADWIVGEALV